MRFLDVQVLLTLSYVDQFDWPLTIQEIEKRLIFTKKNKGQKTKKKISLSLNNLLDLGLISKKNNYFYLKKSRDNFKIRKKYEKFSLEKWTETKEFVVLLKAIPGIKAIFVTGSLAMNAAKKNDDIDFLIVVRKNTLWLLRPLITFLALSRGKARLREFHADNTWCLNMWLEEDSLQVLENIRSVYTAYEVCQATPVLDKNNFAQKFLKENKWVENYLPEYYSQRLASTRCQAESVKELEISNLTLFGIWNFVISILNTIAFVLQRLYMSTHMSHEKVGLKIALFHPRDTRNLIFRRWKESLGKIYN
ncbi:MAG: nucleotidyltransferase domain-containing protein [Patescibacteria group bacterium]